MSIGPMVSLDIFPPTLWAISSLCNCLNRLKQKIAISLGKLKGEIFLAYWSGFGPMFIVKEENFYRWNWLNRPLAALCERSRTSIISKRNIRKFTQPHGGAWMASLLARRDFFTVIMARVSQGGAKGVISPPQCAYSVSFFRRAIPVDLTRHHRAWECV